MPGPEPLRDLHSADPAESDALVELFESYGGGALGLTGAHDLVAAMSVLHLRPPGRRRSLAEAAADVGVSVDAAAQLWTALGFTDEELSDTDVEVLATLGATTDLLGQATALELARVLGLVVRRLADATVSAVRVGFELAEPDGHGSRSGVSRVDLARDYKAMIDAQLPALTTAVDLALRRHLAEFAPRLWSPDA
ncbi:MAG: hypothetical protein AAGK32_22130, partial [Actinomycetota bacterium]